MDVSMPALPFLCFMCVWPMLRPHLGFERGDGVLQLLPELHRHQTFDPLLVLLTHHRHLMRQEAGRANSVSELAQASNEYMCIIRADQKTPARTVKSHV